LSVTSPISPTSTPATVTVWPWPGVTDCAVLNSAWISTRFSHGKRSRWCAVMYAATASDSRTIAPYASMCAP
jgi:hypothetical protein